MISRLINRLNASCRFINLCLRTLIRLSSLPRIDVRLLDTSINETGWDVFTLAYRIDGPIAAVFDADSQKYYSRLFKHLWRSKRIEYVLNNIWKTQMTYVEYVDVIPELKPVYHSFHMLISEMMHFIQVSACLTNVCLLSNETAFEIRFIACLINCTQQLV